jgi:hypothetical protein
MEVNECTVAPTHKLCVTVLYSDGEAQHDSHCGSIRGNTEHPPEVTVMMHTQIVLTVEVDRV